MIPSPDPRQDDLWTAYLFSTGNADMEESPCRCASCRMIADGFWRWKEQQESEARAAKYRERKLKKTLAKATSSL